MFSQGRHSNDRFVAEIFLRLKVSRSLSQKNADSSLTHDDEGMHSGRQEIDPWEIFTRYSSCTKMAIVELFFSVIFLLAVRVVRIM